MKVLVVNGEVRQGIVQRAEGLTGPSDAKDALMTIFKDLLYCSMILPVLGAGLRI